MNIKYFFEFSGLDEVQNRVEILTLEDVNAEEIKSASDPFIIEYKDNKKLTPIQGSGSYINIVSEEIFQFISLHTDEMQKYLVKFYRSGSLYWMGWLDPETYNERLSEYPPYPVNFSAADFNILERLKFRDNSQNAFIGISTLIEQLKRCFDLLSLPFGKLYIGCSTSSPDISLDSNESLLHKLYIQSSNFYDEDDEPMTCREVMESILEPFGLMMLQKDGDVYIYDYNTLEKSGLMKCYDFSNLSYIGDKTVSFGIGDLSNIGFTSTSGDFGFEDMVNNVEITSSIYAEKSFAEYVVSKSDLYNEIGTVDRGDFTVTTYYDCRNWIRPYRNFAFYKQKGDSNEIMGAVLDRNKATNGISQMNFFNERRYIIANDQHYLNIRTDLYVSTRDNPFDQETGWTKELWGILQGDILLLDINMVPTHYFSRVGKKWNLITDGYIPFNQMNYDFFSEISYDDSRIADTWTPMSFTFTEQRFHKGALIAMPPTSGYIHLKYNDFLLYKGWNDRFPLEDIKFILINNVAIEELNEDMELLSTDDTVFKSYVNKKVVSNYGNVTLKCVSVNEKNTAIGKANLLRKIPEGYGVCSEYTRAGQTDILERLLMCTIHSNYTRKNVEFKADINMTANPMMSYATYKSIMDSSYLINGCRLDFWNSKTTIDVVEFSNDAAKLSDIPYD